MGASEGKLNFRKAVVELTTKTQPIDPGDEDFWSQFWGPNQSTSSIQDVFALIPSAEIRALREELPSNLATLCFKTVERLTIVTESSCRTIREQQTAINCIRLLTRILPYIFEEPEWRGFFWSTAPSQNASNSEDASASPAPPLAKTLLATLSDLLFCPDLTVQPLRRAGPEQADGVAEIDSCEYVWAPGVGFAQTPQQNPVFDERRAEILRLLLTCFSETIYLPPPADNRLKPNPWIQHLCSAENRHVLPIFTSLLNVVFSYDPIGYGVPYNYILWNDYSRERLVEICLQVLIVSLENEVDICESTLRGAGTPESPSRADSFSESQRSPLALEGDARPVNMFVQYTSRIHREEDFHLLLRGFIRLLNNPLIQTYLPASCKKISFHQELLILLWKICDINKKFMYYLLKTSEILDLLVPILYFLLESRNDPARVGLIHLGVFLLLLLSGERNFGVRLNKPYTSRMAMPDLPVFNGSHGDLLIISLHKLVTSTQQRLQPLFDCLLTVIVNVSPYLKSLCMLAASKLLHLLEAFSTPWFLLAAPHNHHLVFFLLEAFNNLIQYQFDGNANLVYAVIRKRQLFHHLANLPTDQSSLRKILNKNRSTAAPPATSAPFLRTAPSAVNGATGARAGGGGGAEPASSSPVGRPRPFASSSSVAPAASASASATATANEADDGSSASVSASAAQQQPLLRDAVLGTDRDGSVQFRNPPGGAAAHQAISSSGEFKTSLFPTPTLSIMTAPHLASGHGGASVEKETAPEDHLVRASSVDEPQQVTQYTPPLSPTGEPPSARPPLSGEAAAAALKLGIGTSSSASATAPASDPAAAAAAAGRSAQEQLADAFTRPKGESSGASASASASAGASGRGARSGSQRSAGASSPSPGGAAAWEPTPEWVQSWKSKLPLQTILRMLQVLVPQVEKMCIERGVSDESEIIRFLQHGTLVGLLPVPHPILIRKYQPNAGTALWFRTFMWGVVYLRNVDPPLWYDTDVKLFEVQRV